MLSAIVILLSFAAVAFSSNGADSLQKAINEDVISLPLSSNWSTFNFEQAGNNSTSLFRPKISGNKIAKIEITDLFCNGDVFIVFCGDSYITQTSAVPSLKPCNTLRFTESQADLAFASPEFSSGTFIVPPGCDIKIMPVISRFTAGLGGIRFVEAINPIVQA